LALILVATARQNAESVFRTRHTSSAISGAMRPYFSAVSNCPRVPDIQGTTAFVHEVEPVAAASGNPQYSARTPALFMK
jgi:hypothetical protein